MRSAAEFWNRAAEKYARSPVGNEAAYQTTLDRTRHWLTPQSQVLEIGCGTGTTALKLADAVAHIHGTDIAENMIRIATDKGKAAGVENVSFGLATAETAVAQGPVDTVLAFNILHLVPDVGHVLRHVAQTLPSGGLFISKTPCLGGKPWFRPMVWGLKAIGKAPPDVGFLRPAALQAEIIAQGFEIVETGDYPPSLPSHFVVARKL